MKSPIKALLVLLLVQCVLTALMYWPAGMMDGMRDKKPLLAFNADLLDEINISDRNDNEVVLLRQGEAWVLPDLEELPVDDSMIKDLIDALAYQSHGRPVADSVPARQRFQVTGYHFQRRLTLIGEGELLGTVYLGTSPGFRRVHARNDNGDAIYSIKFNNFDAPAAAASWLQRSLLQIAEPSQIKGPGFEVKREGNVWQTPSGITPDRRELDALLLALASQQIDGVAEEDAQRTLAESPPTLTLEVTTDSGVEKLEYFSLDGGRYVYSGNYPLFFRLSDYDFDRITGIDAQLLAATLTDAVESADDESVSE
ncbi:MAG: DUF4340 domain-containing protein [Halieaceae bacterium]